MSMCKRMQKGPQRDGSLLPCCASCGASDPVIESPVGKHCMNGHTLNIDHIAKHSELPRWGAHLLSSIFWLVGDHPKVEVEEESGQHRQ